MVEQKETTEKLRHSKEGNCFPLFIFKKTSANAKKINYLGRNFTYFSFSVRQHSQEKLRHPQEGNLYSISQEKM